MKKHLFSCFLLFLTLLKGGIPISAFAQTGIYASFNAGVDVSYNRLISDKPLPPDPVALRRAASCFDFGLYYRFDRRFSLDVNVKAAFMKRGLIVKGDDVKDQDPSNRMACLSTMPPQIQVGISVYPVVTPWVEWKVGAGFGPMLFKWDEGRSFDFEMDSEDVYFSAYFEDNRHRQTGWVVNLNTSFAYKVSYRSAFILTLNHNQGIVDVFDYQSLQYSYRDKNAGNSEQYNVRLLNNGSYSSCTIGYSYKLFGIMTRCYGKRPSIQTPRYNL